jgi:hypothetical protein
MEKPVTRIRIIQYINKHPLFRSILLSQLILDYLQYEEAIQIYSLLHCKEPIKPCIPTQLLHNILELKTGEYLPWLISPSVNIWYIPNGKIRISNKILGYLSLFKPRHSSLLWQCPDCKEYRKIESEFNTKKGLYGHKGFMLITSRWSAAYLCDCSAKKLIASEKMGIYSLNEEFIASEKCLANNNYVSAQYKFMDSKTMFDLIELKT